MQVTLRCDRTDVEITVEEGPHGGPNLRAVREAMFAAQQHHEAGEITALTKDGDRLAHMTFEWGDE